MLLQGDPINRHGGHFFVIIKGSVSVHKNSHLLTESGGTRHLSMGQLIMETLSLLFFVASVVRSQTQFKISAVHGRFKQLVDLENGAALLFGGDSGKDNGGFVFGDRMYPKFNSSNSWYSVVSQKNPLLRKNHVLIRVAPGKAFLYGGQCLSFGNFIPCNDGTNSGWLFQQRTTPEGKLTRDIGKWVATLIFQGDDPPKSCISHASVASLASNKFLILGGQCLEKSLNTPVLGAWVGSYRYEAGDKHILSWKKIPRGPSWPSSHLISSAMANLQNNVLLLFGGDIAGSETYFDNRNTYVITYAPSSNRLEWEKQSTTPKCDTKNMCEHSFYFSNQNFGMIKVPGAVVLFNPSADPSPGSYGVGNGGMWYFDMDSKTWTFALRDQLNLIGKNRRYFAMGTVGKSSEAKKIVFGGGYGYSGGDRLADTWLIGNCSMPQQALYLSGSFEDITITAGPKPPQTKNAAMTGYKDMAVMFGGNIEGKEFLGSRNVNDLWVFTKISAEESYTWSTVDHPAEGRPSPRQYTSLVKTLHPTLGDYLLLYGGYNGDSNVGTLADTWMLSMDSMVWHEWKNRRVLNETQMPGLNSYAMAPITNGVLIYGGILPDEMHATMGDKSYKTWFFTCQSPVSGITNNLDNDCNWRLLQSEKRPETTKKRAVALTFNHVIVFPDDYSTCTWMFVMQHLPLVEGEWECVGNFELDYGVSDPSLFVKGSYQTAVVLDTSKTGETHGAIYFVFDSDDANKSTWVYDKSPSTLKDLKDASLASFNPNGTGRSKFKDTEIVIYGGVMSGALVSGKTYMFDSACPSGYQRVKSGSPGITNYKCVACKIGFFKNRKDDDRECTQCPETTTTDKDGRGSIAECIICETNYCDSDGTKSSSVDEEKRMCICECLDDYTSARCSQKTGCVLKMPLFDSLFTGKCELSSATSVWIIIVSSVCFLCCCVACAHNRYSQSKAKSNLDMQLGRVDMYSKLLDESNNLVASVDKELRRLREGWEIRGSDIELLEKVGEGTFATVYRGKWKALNQIDVAIKCLRPNPETKDSIFDENETKVLQGLRHPNLVLMFGAGEIETTGEQFIVTEFVGGGDLSVVLRDEKKKGIPPFPAKKRMIYIKDIVEGMRFLHEKGFLHRDLKAANVLCTSAGRCKVTDFGLSRENKALKEEKTRRMSHTLQASETRSPSLNASVNSTKADMTSFMGSILWMAPEIMRNKTSQYNEFVDVFSFGMVLYEIITSQHPWEDCRNIKTIDDVVDAIEAGNRPEVPDGLGFPPFFKDLMEKCWNSNCEMRPSFQEMSFWLQGKDI